jgi:hypothetical protein
LKTRLPFVKHSSVFYVYIVSLKILIMKKKLLSFISVSVAVVLVLGIAGCEKDKKDEAPPLPPLTSMVIDLNGFNTGKVTGTYNNIGMAVGAVLYWNSMLTLGLAIPVASYTEAFNHEAVRVDNDTWQWTYDVEVNDTLVTAVLTADVTGEMVNWEMSVSKQDDFQDFVWYTGICDILATSGTWTLYKSPDDPTELIGITWNHDYDKDTFDVEYLDISGGQYDGSYISFEMTEDPVFNAVYEVHNALQQTTLTIHYNTETHEGNITNGINTYCWAADYKDIACD